MSKILDSIITVLKDLTVSEDFTAFLTKPITDGKCYHIGDVSELLETTENISSEDIDTLIHDRSVKITDDYFTIQYITNYKADPDDPNDEHIIILGHKISPKFLFVSGIIVQNKEVALNPCFAIIPLEDTSLDTKSPGYILELFNDMMEDSVSMSFICFLDNVSHAFSFGDITFFYIGVEDPDKEKDLIEDVATSMKTLVIDVLYRFFTIKEEGREIKVFPNTDFSPKGYITIKDRSTSYHVLKCPACEEFLGFTKRTPEE